MKIHIGTSGFTYPHWMNGRFYPENFKGDQFAFYANHFNTVELNTTHYNFPKSKSINLWYNKSDPDFVWSVKVHRYITHRKYLTALDSTLDFLHVVKEFKEKLGIVLFQLPPKWNLNLERLELLLAHLPNEINYAFEFRNKTWLTEDVYTLLWMNDISFCIYDFNYFLTPPIVTNNRVYLRFHGPGKPYSDRYDSEFIREWARKIVCWHLEGKTVYCYFDNDNMAYAVYNALELKEEIRRIGVII